MRKILPLLLIVLFTSTFAFSQGKTNQAIASQIKSMNAEKYLQIDYVKSVGVTKILGFGENFGRDQVKENGLSELSFGITFNYAGDKLTSVPEAFIMTFWVKSDKPKFAQSHGLKFMNGAENLDLGDARYAVKSSEKGMEFLNFVISRENLMKIAESGSNAQIMLGDSEFKFSPEHIKLFKIILAVSNLP